MLSMEPDSGLDPTTWNYNPSKNQDLDTQPTGPTRFPILSFLITGFQIPPSKYDTNMTKLIRFILGYLYERVCFSLHI